jgi:hypothetical protein
LCFRRQSGWIGDGSGGDVGRGAKLAAGCCGHEMCLVESASGCPQRRHGWCGGKARGWHPWNIVNSILVLLRSEALDVRIFS